MTVDQETFVQTVCAVAGTVVAIAGIGISTWVAVWVAVTDRRIGQRDLIVGRERFFDAVLGLASYALSESNKAADALCGGADPAGIWFNWRHRLLDVSEALRPVRAQTPIDVQLMVSVARFERALHPDSNHAGFSYPADVVRQHAGSIGLTVAKIETARMRLSSAA